MRNFTVHNVRLGLATNSSSTHSLIYIDPRKPPPSDEDVDGEQFGWSHFTAASKRAKLGYVAQTLKNNLGMLTPEFADAVIRSWVGDYDGGGYLDHQSSMTLPASWNGKGIDKKFFDEFKHFMTRDDVAVLGGNDNDDESHPLASNTFDVGLPLDGNGQSDNFVARKDVRSGFWTLFNRLDGTKIRMSFDAPEKSVKPRKAEVPELIDVKLTDHCTFGCSYCAIPGTMIDAAVQRDVDGVAQRPHGDVLRLGGESDVTRRPLGDPRPTGHHARWSASLPRAACGV